MIARSGFPNALDMLKATVKSHIALCEGQGDDLILGAKAADGDYVSMCERKTGEAFALAAELGALAAGGDPVPYRKYGLDFGVVFQLRDDMADGEAPVGALELLEKAERDLSSTFVCRKLGEWWKN
jgi:geranylgeranyl pyrophosphate synthase